MLDAQSPRYLHFLQNAALIAISLFFFFPDLYVVACSYVLQILGPRTNRWRARRVPGFRPQTILVTGVSMSKGLHLARTFYLAGHDVVGADFEAYNVPVAGRFSRALKHFYPLPHPGVAEYPKGRDKYKDRMLGIVRRHNIALWVSCSGVATAVEDARMMVTLTEETQCRCIQFAEDTTTTLDDKARFNTFVESLKLPAPEAHMVRSRQDVHRTLASRPRDNNKSFILKSVAMNDAVRGDMTLLPRRTVSATYDHVSSIPISQRQPFILQEFVKGDEYCTHALVVKNAVQTFTACRSTDLLMHYDALKPSTPLHDAMLKFTREFASRTEQDLTGHLSFDFIVVDKSTEAGVEQRLYPIECNPRAHTAVVLFQDDASKVAKKYLAAAAPDSNDPKRARLTNGINLTTSSNIHADPAFPTSPKPVYWIGHDLVTLVLHPLLRFLTLGIGARELVLHWYQFAQHVLFWKEGTFEVWDPLPFFWLYHVYWPAMFGASILFGQWWSRVNVSTTKRFAVA
jgi:catechol O-methyltransferase